MEMKSKKLTALLLCLVLAMTILAGCGDSGGGDEGGSTPGSKVVINFPTAATTGALYPLGAAITNLWSEELDYVNANAQASAGGVENLNLLAGGEAQVSIAISSNCYESFTGTGTFDGRQNENFRVIGGLYYNPNQVVVTGDSGVNSLADVAGKRFATGDAGSSTEGESNNHFTAAGLNYPGDLKAEYIGFTEAVDLMRNRQLDGAWIMAGLGNAAVTESTATADCKLLSIDDDVIASLQADYPWYARYIIPAGTYANQDEDVQTTAIKMVMFTTADLDEDVVYDLTKTFWENLDHLSESNTSLKECSVESALTDIADLPLHPGAQRYYEELGLL